MHFETFLNAFCIAWICSHATLDENLLQYFSGAKYSFQKFKVINSFLEIALTDLCHTEFISNFELNPK